MHFSSDELNGYCFIIKGFLPFRMIEDQFRDNVSIRQSVLEVQRFQWKDHAEVKSIAASRVSTTSTYVQSLMSIKALKRCTYLCNIAVYRLEMFSYICIYRLERVRVWDIFFHDYGQFSPCCCVDQIFGFDEYLELNFTVRDTVRHSRNSIPKSAPEISSVKMTNFHAFEHWTT